MYMEATIFCESIIDVTEIPRRAVFNNNSIYTVNKDQQLLPVKLEIKATKENTLIVKGLPDSTRIVIEPVIDAKDSMKVSIKLDQNKSNP